MAYDPPVCAIVAIVVLAVAWICVILRLYVRLYLQRNLAVDDILSVAASVRQLDLLIARSNTLRRSSLLWHCDTLLVYCATD
jgi:hypothetical protein